MPVRRRNDAGHAALRRGRVSLPQQVYHVTMTTAERAPLFLDFRIARIVAACLNRPSLLFDARTLCWVLMPDHLHWLVELGERQTLSALVRRFKSVSAREINLRVQRTHRAVWAPAFYDHALRRNEDVEAIARYIVGNPVRAGLCEHSALYSHWDAAWDWDW